MPALGGAKSLKLHLKRIKVQRFWNSLLIFRYLGLGRPNHNRRAAVHGQSESRARDHDAKLRNNLDFCDAQVTTVVIKAKGARLF